jgi:3-deoxy-D-manno-octulosonate 8-phosphate phosphatase (KDO 8-P phosphatase)
MKDPIDAKEIEARAKRIKLLILDVDGVLTDGLVTYLPDGQDSRTFHVRDQLGVQLFAASGGKVVLLSGRESESVRRRGEEMGVHKLCLGIEDKVDAYEAMVAEFQVEEIEVAYVGDDLPDLPLLARAGLGFAVADAAPEVRMKAHAVLRAPGGRGAVREACECILKAKDAWKM